MESKWITHPFLANGGSLASLSIGRTEAANSLLSSPARFDHASEIAFAESVKAVEEGFGQQEKCAATWLHSGKARPQSLRIRLAARMNLSISSSLPMVIRKNWETFFPENQRTSILLLRRD